MGVTREHHGVGPIGTIERRAGEGAVHLASTRATPARRARPPRGTATGPSCYCKPCLQMRQHNGNPAIRDPSRAHRGTGGCLDVLIRQARRHSQVRMLRRRRVESTRGTSPGHPFRDRGFFLCRNAARPSGRSTICDAEIAQSFHRLRERQHVGAEIVGEAGLRQFQLLAQEAKLGDAESPEATAQAYELAVKCTNCCGSMRTL
jgi:hypothetical protein